MKRTTIRSRVGANGILQVTVPLELTDANVDVDVTIEPAPLAPISEDEWRRWVKSFAGSIDDPHFDRQAQGEWEQRDPLN